LKEIQPILSKQEGLCKNSFRPGNLEGKEKARNCWRGLSVGVNHEKPIISQRHAQARFKGGRSLVVLNIRRDVIERGGTNEV
jgi:hypothetical protein